MELTYMVRGSDGKEYGPATLQQLNAWIQEGRLPQHQEVKRSDMGYWAIASAFAELEPGFASSPSAPAGAGGAAVAAAPRTAAPATAVDPLVLRAMKSSASWFYWVAGLSLINSISAFSGSSWRFIIGLGITQVFDGVGEGLGGAGKGVALVLDLLAAGLFVLFGVFAHKAHTWAFIVGMVLFTLDALLLLMGPDWLGLAFHAFVVYSLFRGYSLCRKLRGG
jgi:hypothetical protein